VIEDPDNDGLMLFLHAKNNMGARPQGLAFRLLQTFVDGLARPVSYVAWESQPVAMSANEALQAANVRNEERRTIDEAIEFLRDKLSAGPLAVREIDEHARALGLSRRTLFRARKTLQVQAVKNDFGSGWSLALTEECQTAQECHVK
jgi:putative DNA primase/helicase